MVWAARRRSLDVWLPEPAVGRRSRPRAARAAPRTNRCGPGWTRVCCRRVEATVSSVGNELRQCRTFDGGFLGHGLANICRWLGKLKALGANVVRVHLQFGKFMQGPSHPNRAALRRFARMLKLAEATGAVSRRDRPCLLPAFGCAQVFG